jgi:5-methylcytosine-specific restriction enzyme A
MPEQERRAPDWKWDEIVLACDLTARNGWQQLYPDDEQVIALSELLQRLDLYPPEVRGEKFRNPNGVSRKTLDIITALPGRVGFRSNGGRLTAEVVREFIDRPEVMRSAAETIRASLSAGEVADLPSDVGYGGESELEGRYLLRIHAYRERSPGLRRRKIDSVRRRGQPIACAACGFDFETVYGDRGCGYIECHHVVPLHETGERKVSIRDLALLCSNCHRMIHAKPPWPTPEELRQVIRRQANAGGS